MPQFPPKRPHPATEALGFSLQSCPRGMVAGWSKGSRGTLPTHVGFWGQEGALPRMHPLLEQEGFKEKVLLQLSVEQPQGGEGALLTLQPG